MGFTCVYVYTRGIINRSTYTHSPIVFAVSGESLETCPAVVQRSTRTDRIHYNYIDAANVGSSVLEKFEFQTRNAVTRNIRETLGRHFNNNMCSSSSRSPASPFPTITTTDPSVHNVRPSVYKLCAHTVYPAHA